MKTKRIEVFEVTGKTSKKLNVARKDLIVKVNYTAGIEKILVGKIAYFNNKIIFEYDEDFIKSGIELSPFKLKLQSGIILSTDNEFDGLFGVFNDSLPDGWGRLLLERKLMQAGIYPSNISPLERLCYVGKNGMGALIYEPDQNSDSLINYENIERLDEIAIHAAEFQKAESDTFVDELLSLNGSSAGARPKILIQLNKMNNMNQNNHWIIKFRSTSDPKDIGSIEYAYHLLAIAAKLEVPTAKLFSSKNCSGYFGVERFDRANNKRIHMHTASGLIHTDHRFPSLDYQILMKLTQALTKDMKECEKLFRLSVFNVLMHNRDDHAKNFTYLLDTESKYWKLSPAYDLTYSFGPNGEHSTSVMGEGKFPTIQHLFKLAEVSGIKKDIASTIIEEVRAAKDSWQKIAKQANVSPDSFNLIQKSFNAIDKIIFK